MEIQRITSRQNSLMVTVGKLYAARKQRQKYGLYPGDGRKLLEEALRWAPESLHTVILKEGLPWPELPGHVRRAEVPEGLMEQVSRLDTPEGVIFLMRLPSLPEGEPMPGTLVLDGLQDPGNVGTILRTADAMDIPVLLTEGCADPFNPKTVRSAMGALFRSSPACIRRQDLVNRCRSDGVPLLVTALTDGAEDLRGVALREGVVVIGSEGHGVSGELLEAADRRLFIPMHPRCESLNAAAAAAIVLWQMTAI